MWVSFLAGTTPKTFLDKEWHEETDRRLQAWPRVAGPPVIMNPISRQSFIVKSRSNWSFCSVDSILMILMEQFLIYFANCGWIKHIMKIMLDVWMHITLQALSILIIITSQWTWLVGVYFLYYHSSHIDTFATIWIKFNVLRPTNRDYVMSYIVR